MIVNITNDRNLTDYANKLKIGDVKVLYEDLRQYVQEYLMTGLRVNYPVQDWIKYGLNFSFIEDLIQGDFY